MKQRGATHPEGETVPDAVTDGDTDTDGVLRSMQQSARRRHNVVVLQRRLQACADNASSLHSEALTQRRTRLRSMSRMSSQSQTASRRA